MEEQVERFWKLDNFCEEKRYLTESEHNCETIFEETTRRDKDGRFIVNIPLKPNFASLGDSKQMAIKRFYSLERRLSKDDNSRTLYNEFMNEYEKLGHMTEISSTSDEIEYYLPHHPVMREESVTTKLRVVFDGSAKTTTNLSLNDVQLVGPVVQSDLFSILLRFRKHKFIAVADIEKISTD